jgi:ferredoxin-NADP reductase
VTPWYLATAPSSVLAALSTLHVALALVRMYRAGSPARGRALTSLSLLFAISPWIWMRPRDLAVGLAAHLVWFAISGRLGVSKPVPPAMVETALPAQAAPVARPGTPPASPARARDFVAAPVLAVFDETSDIRTFRLGRPQGFDFRPGQFLTVRLQIEGRPVSRCYSIRSSPGSRGYLEISVKRQGLVSSTLHAAVRPGSLLSIRTPAGAFVYPDGDDRPLVLVSGGVGCTPMISMLRHAVACEPSRAVVYLFSAKTEQDIAFRQELALIGRRHPQVRIVIALTRGEGSPRFYAGRIDEKLMRQIVPDPLQSLFYVCGPKAMIEGTRTLLAGMGVPASQVRSEAFEAAVAASRAPSPPAAPGPETVLVAAAASSGRRSSPSVRLSISGKTAAVSGGQTLLEAAEAARVEIASSCRAGVCGTCRTRLVSGDVECSADAMEESDREQGYIYPCVAWAKGDCVLEA